MTITMNSLIRHDSEEVVNYNEIDNVVALRDRAVELYTQGLKLISESVSLAKEAVSKNGVTLYYPGEAINSDISNIDSLTGTVDILPALKGEDSYSVQTGV